MSRSGHCLGLLDAGPEAKIDPFFGRCAATAAAASAVAAATAIPGASGYVVYGHKYRPHHARTKKNLSSSLSNWRYNFFMCNLKKSINMFVYL